MSRFFFAWCDPSTPFDPAVHNVEDEDVYSFTFSQAEGDFATLQVTFNNPRIGLLNPSRKVWAWFSWDNGTEVEPLFFGRVVGVPSNIFAKTLTVDFVARPIDFVAQKQTLADTLKVAPYWDPVFLNDDALIDPDSVLEARSALWHIDPITHVVSISDVLVGEDGTVESGTDDILDENLAVTMGTPPARSVTVTASVKWDNAGTGYVMMDNYIVRNWPNYGDTTYKYQMISSYTFQGLQDDWPQPEKSIGKGWQVYTGDIVNVAYSGAWLAATNLNSNNIFPKWLTVGEVFGKPDGALIFKNWPALYKTLGEWPPKTVFDIEPFFDVNDNADIIIVPIGWGRPHLTVMYNASREYSENVTFTLGCDMQPIVTLPDESDSIAINITGNSVSDTIAGEVPIVDPRRTSYFDSDRGRDSIGHLIQIARATLIIKSRAVQIQYELPFRKGLAATLRKNALVHDPRLPGGQALGKIVAYQHELDGDRGALLTTLTIACAVGRGGDPYTAVEGDPVYAADGYMSKGYQKYDNEVQVTPTSDVAYSVDLYQPDDDGFRMTKQYYAEDVVRLFQVTDGPVDQYDALDAIARKFDSATLAPTLQQHPTKVTLSLVPATGGPFVTDVPMSVEDLIIPKQIDLEAASNA